MNIHMNTTHGLLFSVQQMCVQRAGMHANTPTYTHSDRKRPQMCETRIYIHKKETVPTQYTTQQTPSLCVSLTSFRI